MAGMLNCVCCGALTWVGQVSEVNLTSKCGFVMSLVTTLHMVCYSGKYSVQMSFLLSFALTSSEVYGRFSELLAYAAMGWWLAEG